MKQAKDNQKIDAPGIIFQSIWALLSIIFTVQFVYKVRPGQNIDNNMHGLNFRDKFGMAKLSKKSSKNSKLDKTKNCYRAPMQQKTIMRWKQMR